MAEEKVGVLTPAQRRTLQQGLADCASCGTKLAYLREAGAPQEELELRRDHTANVIETALAVDAKLRDGK